MSGSDMTDMILAKHILPYLDKKLHQKKIHVFENIDSTNAEAKRMALNGFKDGTVVIANAQSAGRGRMGRSFYSPPGSGIYLSYLIRPRMGGDKLLAITAASAVAVCRAIQNVTGKKPLIKWVNDLYLDNKKICGILAEAVTGADGIEAIIIGVGINCTTTFDGELSKIAGSLYSSTKDINIRNELAAELVNQLGNVCQMTESGEFADEYRENSMILGKKITVCGESDSMYTVEDIGTCGELILRGEDGQSRTLNTGEVSIRPADKTLSKGR